MFLLDQRDPKSTRHVLVGSVGRVFCMQTKLVADRRLVRHNPGCAVVTLPSLGPVATVPLAFLALCDAASPLSRAGNDSTRNWPDYSHGRTKSCPSSQLLCLCREGFLLTGFCHMEHVSPVCCLLCSRNISHGESSWPGQG